MYGKIDSLRVVYTRSNSTKMVSLQIRDSVTMTKDYLRRIFPSKRLFQYVLGNLRPGHLHIYVGNGSNGKTSFINILSLALAHMHPRVISQNEFNNSPIKNFKNNSLLIVNEWNSAIKLPINRTLEFLRSGHLVIIETNTLPVFNCAANELLNTSHVIKFKSYFRDGPANELDYIYTKTCESPTIFADHLTTLIMNSSPNQKAPKTVREMKEKLKQLATSSSAVYNNTVAAPANAAPANAAPANAAPANAAPANAAPANACPHESTIVNNNVPENTVIFADDSMTSTPVYMQISIVLIPNDTTWKDDILTINVDPDSDSDKFILTFDQRSMRSYTSIRLTEEDIYEYLLRFFSAATYDISPYKYVQFCVPLFPTVSVHLEQAQTYVKNELMCMIDWLIPDWPEEHTNGGINLH